MVIAWMADGFLGLMILCLAWQALAGKDPIRAVAMFVAMGLLIALVWVRLDAPDVAIAEAAIGAGLTGALLLITIRRQRARSTDSSTQGRTMTTPIERVRHFVVIIAVLMLAALLGLAIVGIPGGGQGLAFVVADALPDSGVSNPVTAVLLNFRAFDTLLEIGVLLLALLAVWALGLRLPDAETLPASPLVTTLLRINLPLLTIIAGYLLWIGATAPGGAFQAGAVLAGVGVLMRLCGVLRLSRSLLRWMAIAGLLMFITVALAMLAWTGGLLQYPVGAAGTWILVIETVATLSIAAILTALFVGQEPDLKEERP